MNALVACTIVTSLASITSLIVVIVQYHRSQEQSSCARLIIVIIYADVLWQAVLVFFFISIPTKLYEINWINDTMIITYTTLAAVTATFSTIVAFSSYISIMYSEAFLRAKLKIYIQVGLSTSIILGLIAGILCTLRITSRNNHQEKLYVYSNDIALTMLLFYPIFLISLSLSSYMSIYFYFKRNYRGKPVSSEVKRLFIFPLIMIMTNLWPFAADLSYSLSGNSMATAILTFFCYVFLSLVGLFDALAYGWTQFKDSDSKSSTPQTSLSLLDTEGTPAKHISNLNTQSAQIYEFEQYASEVK